MRKEDHFHEVFKIRVAKIYNGEEEVLNASIAERGYLAGLIDGEGGVEIDIRLMPKIRIAMKNLLPYQLCKKYGGCITKHYEKSSLIYTWHIYALKTQKGLAEFIYAIINDTKIKRQQLELLLEAITVKEEKRQDWKKKMLEIKEEIQRLNRLNPIDLPEVPHSNRKGRKLKGERVV